ncbi:hypothetical protein [Caldimonas sp. KR1-144]|uniref:hypothetical protein n=1 Tax=Caldimonas sp. KR1-144 TaxID=3400911 RepID=UPI003BFEB27C
MSTEQLREALEARLAEIMPLFVEARDALPAISEAARKLHGISPTLAERMDAVGTKDWRAALASTAALAQQGEQTWQLHFSDARDFCRFASMLIGAAYTDAQMAVDRINHGTLGGEQPWGSVSAATPSPSAALSGTAEAGEPGILDCSHPVWWLESAIDDYIDGYTFEADEGSYTPTDTERAVIKDAFMGLLADTEFCAAMADVGIVAAHPSPAAPQGQGEPIEGAPQTGKRNCPACRNADSWGFPDKAFCASCTLTIDGNGTKFEPLNSWAGSNTPSRDAVAILAHDIRQQRLAARPTPAAGPTDVLRLLNAELVPTLIAVLRRREHTISDDDRGAMLEAADETVASFASDLPMLRLDGKTLPEFIGAELFEFQEAPEPDLSAAGAEFAKWFAANYYGEVVFGDPGWHAAIIFRNACAQIRLAASPTQPATEPAALSDAYKAIRAARRWLTTDLPEAKANALVELRKVNDDLYAAQPAKQTVSEPSEGQVEAAAKAICRGEWGVGEYAETCFSKDRSYYMNVARKALTAASEAGNRNGGAA